MKKQKQGFALLYAILLTGAILTVGVILMNIITKQLIFSSLNRQSELSYYYIASTARECLIKDTITYKFVSLDESSDPPRFIVNPDTQVTINCFGKDLLLTKTNPYTFALDDFAIDDEGNKVNLSVQINASCLNGGESCQPVVSGQDLVVDKYRYFGKADGYSGSGDRMAKRTVVFAQKP